MTLWEINEAIMACVDAETGEIIDFDQLDKLTMAREEKLENIALYTKALDAEAAAIREEEKTLAARRKVKENKAARLREYLSDALAGQPFETAKVALSFRSSQAVKVTDSTALLDWLESNYDDCLTYKTPAVRLDAVKMLIKRGIDVPGAEIETRNNLQMK